MKKSNKTIAGYHLLMILSTVNQDFDSRADNIVREFLSQESPFPMNLDNELEEIIQLEQTELKEHFTAKVNDFYDDSTPEERKDFIALVKSLIRADHEITCEENDFYRILLREFSNKDKKLTT